MIGRKALAVAKQVGRGKASGLAAKKKQKRWRAELADEIEQGGAASDLESDAPLGRLGLSSASEERGRERTPSEPRRRRSKSPPGEKPRKSRSRRRSRSRPRSSASSRNRQSASRSRARARSRSRRSRSRARRRAVECSKSREGAGGSPLGSDALGPALSEVVSFSDFVRHCDRLIKLGATAPAPDLALLCKNMAQAKYFDGDLMSEVWRNLRTQIPSRQHTLADITDIIASLRDLNAYDEGVFKVAAAVVMPQVPVMTQEQRKFWLDTYRELKHQGDDEFARVLAKGPCEDAAAFDPAPGGKAARIRQVLCMLHGKQRSIDMMVDEGGGHYTCAPNRRCK